jgi:putative cell wall-binding protein
VQRPVEPLHVQRGRLPEYLYGVVPRESPASWNAEALKAQAVVARSYAKRKVDPDDNGVRDANLLSTTADQMYGGHSRLVQGVVVPHEDSRTNAAVDATKDKIVKYGSTIVQTFFFSASGGRTANIEDSWSYSSPQPYFTGVDDPYGLDIAADLRASDTVASELSNHGLPRIPGASTVWVTGITITRGVSDYPRWVYFHFSDTAKTVCKLSAYTVKSALGLKSPKFSFSGFPMSRIQGANRYDTAVVISQRAFGGTAPAVVIASGEDYPDALTGSALAGAEKGALLLTGKANLPAVVETELERLKPSRVYIMGSAAAVGSTVESRVRAVLPSATVTRIEGVDRYETARKAADKVFSLKASTKAIVANGAAWPDAAAVSALAYAKAYPILLAKPSTLGTATAEYLSARKPAMTYVIGSETVVPKAVSDAIVSATGKSALRLAGSNRYSTAAAVARQCVSLTEGFSVQDVYITTGLNYPDALSGGVLAGSQGHPMLLTHPDFCPSGTAAFLTEKKLVIGYIWILGGGGAISSRGAGAIDDVMMD